MVVWVCVFLCIFVLFLVCVFLYFWGVLVLQLHICIYTHLYLSACWVCTRMHFSKCTRGMFRSRVFVGVYISPTIWLSRISYSSALCISVLSIVIWGAPCSHINRHFKMYIFTERYGDMTGDGRLKRTSCTCVGFAYCGFCTDLGKRVQLYWNWSVVGEETNLKYFNELPC